MAIEGKNIGFLNQMQYKVIEMNPELEFVFLYCIIRQELLVKSVLTYCCIVDVVSK